MTKNNYLLQGKNKGYNQSLTGKVVFLYILLSDSKSNWNNQNKKNRCMKEIKQASRLLMKEASRQHTSLEIKDYFMEAPIDYVISHDTPDGWHDEVAANLSRPSLLALQNEIKRKNQAKEVAVVFMLNRMDRSFAYNATTDSSDDEYAVVFADEKYCARSIVHEVLHLFGAVDYYYIPRIMKAAQKYLGMNIMMSTHESDVIDDFTMYLIGWHNILTPNASSFLQDVGHVSQKEVEKALRAQYKNGPGKIIYPDGIIYEGDLINGIPNGYGKFTYPDGTQYVGGVKNAQYHGKGKIIYSNGAVQTGIWKDGQLT